MGCSSCKKKAEAFFSKKEKLDITNSLEKAEEPLVIDAYVVDEDNPDNENTSLEALFQRKKEILQPKIDNLKKQKIDLIKKLKDINKRIEDIRLYLQANIKRNGRDIQHLIDEVEPALEKFKLDNPNLFKD